MYSLKVTDKSTKNQGHHYKEVVRSVGGARRHYLFCVFRHCQNLVPKPFDCIAKIIIVCIITPNKKNYPYVHCCYTSVIVKTQGLRHQASDLRFWITIFVLIQIIFISQFKTKSWCSDWYYYVVNGLINYKNYVCVLSLKTLFNRQVTLYSTTDNTKQKIILKQEPILICFFKKNCSAKSESDLSFFLARLVIFLNRIKSCKNTYLLYF